MRLALALILAAGPAMADVFLREPDADDGSIAHLVHQNNLTTGLNLRTFSVELEGYGPISGTVDNTPNIRCDPACPDVLTINGIPEGIAVETWQITTAERAESIIRIFLGLGF